MLFAAPAQAQGELGTLPTGHYLCELPGDAAGLGSRPVEGHWFDVVNASRYVSDGGDGTYLLTGKSVVFTRGPMRGARFEWNGMKALKRTDLAGEMAKLRCVRTGRGAAG
jgi:hypothetical protein